MVPLPFGSVFFPCRVPQPISVVFVFWGVQIFSRAVRAAQPITSRAFDSFVASSSATSVSQQPVFGCRAREHCMHLSIQVSPVVSILFFSSFSSAVHSCCRKDNPACPCKLLPVQCRRSHPPPPTSRPTFSRFPIASPAGACQSFSSSTAYCSRPRSFSRKSCVRLNSFRLLRGSVPGNRQA